MKMGMYLAGVLDAPTVRPPTEAPRSRKWPRCATRLRKPAFSSADTKGHDMNRRGRPPQRDLLLRCSARPRRQWPSTYPSKPVTIDHSVSARRHARRRRPHARAEAGRADGPELRRGQPAGRRRHDRRERRGEGARPTATRCCSVRRRSSTTPMTMPTAPYDAIKDFTPIALVAKAPLAGRHAQGPAVQRHQGADRVRQGQSRQHDVRGRLVGVGRPHVHGAPEARGRHRATSSCRTRATARRTRTSSADASMPSSTRSSDRQSHAKAGKLKVIAVTSKERVPACRTRPPSVKPFGLRVLQLVRPVGPREAA